MFTETRPLQVGIAKSSTESASIYHSLWRGLQFGVPYKGGNFNDVSQGARSNVELQNVSSVAGAYGSAMYRQPDVKSFAWYTGGHQYTFTNHAQWQLSWAMDKMDITYLPGSPFGSWFYLGVSRDNKTTTHGSFFVYTPWFTNTLRLRIWTSAGWSNLTWLGGSPDNGRHTFTLRKNRTRIFELIVDGVSFGERTAAAVVAWVPGIKNGIVIGAPNPHPTASPSGWKARWHSVCLWNRILEDHEQRRWEQSPLGMFTPVRRRLPTPPLYVPPVVPGRPCDWFDPLTGAPWQADAAAQDWQAPRAGSSWSDGQADRDWHDDKPGSGWYDDKECS